MYYTCDCILNSDYSNGRVPKNCKIVIFDHLEGGVSQNHTPYYKVYIQRKYTLFGGKTMVTKNSQ